MIVLHILVTFLTFFIVFFFYFCVGSKQQVKRRVNHRDPIRALSNSALIFLRSASCLFSVCVCWKKNLVFIHSVGSANRKTRFQQISNRGGFVLVHDFCLILSLPRPRQSFTMILTKQIMSAILLHPLGTEYVICYARPHIPSLGIAQKLPQSPDATLHGYCVMYQHNNNNSNGKSVRILCCGSATSSSGRWWILFFSPFFFFMLL